MKKIIIILFYFIFCCLFYSQGQQINGFYRLSFPLNDETENSYFIFNKDSFVCYTLGNSIYKFDTEDELKSYGVGHYSFVENKFVLHFNTGSLIVPIYIEDSLSLNLNTIKNQKGTNIIVNFIDEINYQQHGSLFVETSRGEIYKNFGKSSYAKIYIQEGSIITSIKVGMVNMPLKNLPILENYNNIVYNLFARDKKSAVKVFINEKFEFDIIKKLGDSVFLVNRSSGFQKLSKKELQFLNKVTLLQDPRLKMLFEYFAPKRDF